MNGANADVSANTIIIPSKTSTKSIGASHHFFLWSTKNQSSAKMDIFAIGLSV